MSRVWPGAALAAAALLTAPAGAQEWTRFRGPNGTGISTAKDIPVSWTERDFRWRVPLAGEGHAQPVFWGDKIFVPSARNQGRERLLQCLNRADGAELWSRAVPLSTHNKHRLNSYASSTPAVDADRVVACFVDPAKFLVKAWDHAGRELWSVDLGPFVSQHGHGASPILYEGKVIVTNDEDGASFVAALDVKDGSIVWKTPRDPALQGTAYSTPCILQIDGGAPQLLLTSQAHGISSLDPRTGKPNWQARVFDKRAVSSPVVAGNLVIGTCGAGGGGHYVSAVRLGGSGDVTDTHVAYTIREKAPYCPTPLVVGDRLYLISDDGVAGAFEASTGRAIWSGRVGGTFYGAPILIDGKIYANSKEGQTAVWEAADAFKVLARNPLGEGSHTAPAVDGGRLYLRTFTHLVCVGSAP
jgi:outer membrane protein assembly factor BamB